MSWLLVVITTPLNAFAALSTGCAMYLYISYGMPVIAGMFAEKGNSWTKFGAFRLGLLSRVFAFIVLLGTIAVTIAGHAFVPSIPATATTSYVPGLWVYSLGFVIILLVLWFAIENRRFQGPPIGEAAIKKRQAEIAAAEAALARG